MRYVPLLALLLAISLPLTSKASTLINDMQSCQALNQFVIDKLASSDSPYSNDKVDEITEGLKLYNKYIQDEIVSPGLLEFNGGNKTKSDEMQKQVDAYKAQLIGSLEKRYTSNKMVADYAISINDCAKKSVPKGDALEALKLSLNSLLLLAQGG